MNNVPLELSNERQAMTETEKNELRVKVATLRGIKATRECPECYGTGYGGSEMDHLPCDWCKTTGKVKPYYVSPDYPNDLNACAEFENGLTDEQYRSYCLRLYDEHGQYGCISATATQRCLAFVKTMEEKR